ncbi:MAG: hypothetical protein JO040_05035 [Gemmatimonadetes bacterium]|nr:hypothetical protein [Gemmatimonadota bacterium]
MSERLARRPGLVLALALVTAASAACTARAQSWRTVNSSRQVWGEKNLNVQVEYGAGRLTVAPASQPLLYQFQMRYDEDRVAPVTTYDRRTGTLRLATQQNDRRGSRKVSDEARATVNLTRDVPLALDVKFGAGEANLDLGGLSLRNVRLATGASDTRVSFSTPNRIPAEGVRMEAGAASFSATGLGNTRAERFEFEGGVGEATLDFSGAWDRSASASVKMGIGSLTLRFPRSVGVKVVKDSFLTSFDGSGMVKRGNAYYSRNWDSAPNRLTVTVEAALGSIDIDWIDS